MGILEYHSDKWQPEPNSGCHLWMGSCAGGANSDYPRAWYNGKVVQVTRIVCEETNGPPPSLKHVAMHKCEVPCCVNPDHIKWGTHSDNAFHRTRNMINPNWGTYKRNGHIIANVNGKYLGQFASQEEANNARDLFHKP